LDPENSAPEGFDDDDADAVYSTDNEEAKESDRVSRARLGPLSRKRFKVMLRAMAGKRGQVARCMAFALEHGEAAAEVANIVISSLLIESTPVPRKMARLHLISDIIHNSAVALPSAWKYRQEFQQRLGLVFDHLSTIYHSFAGRMTAETFKRQVVAVIDVWDDRIVFPPDQTAIWRERLDGKEAVKELIVETIEEEVVQEQPVVSRFKSAFKPVTDPEGVEDMELDDEEEEKPQDQVQEAPNSLAGEEDEDLDGAPVIDDDLDGEALDEDIDGAPIEDIDGAPLDAGDIDGEPLDLDGDPIE
jgi:U2-associated protein SR140